MKFHCFIGAFFLMLTVACHRPVETVCTPSLQPKLIAIDTLMQSRPDSALKALYSCTDTSNVSASDRHYYQLLLSEALYKNDFAQQNRPELLDAMAYFDSIGDAFLSARCHHMNGVGYYEMDSVVAACAEYMKAVEIMESHFEERDLMEYKAKFMALAYTHLSVLFSDQYLHEQAIYFGKCALLYYNRYDAEPWHVAWIFNMIGSHDEILEKYDDAKFYYRCAIDILPDTNNMMYRDISSHLALLLYESGKNKTTPLHQLYRLANISENRTEKTIRYASIGMIYYLETQYDSAWKYLDRVYNETTNIALKKQSAEWLIEICKIQNNFSGVPFYTDYLAQFALLNETQGSVKSGLSELFLHYEKKNQELTQKNKTTQLLRVVGLIFGCSILVFVFFGAFYINNNKRKRLYQEKQIADLTNKWKDTKVILQKEREALAIAEKKIKANSFAEEPICMQILNLVKKQNFKAKIDYINYKEFALDNNHILALRNVVNMHYDSFLKTLKEKYPKLTDDDLNYCCLYLLGLKEADIAALMQRSFSTVCYRSRKIRGYINSKEPLYVSLHNIIKTL